jgi:hypothetical protein
VGDPETTQVFGLIDSPFGKVGLAVQDVGVPPDIAGLKDADWLSVRE